jgi:hypothetical protein
MFKGRGGYISIGAVVGVYLAVCFIYYYDRHVLLLVRSRDYVYLQRYYLFVIFIFLNYICGIVQVYLLIGLSIQCVVFLVSSRLCYMSVLCQVYI